MVWPQYIKISPGPLSRYIHWACLEQLYTKASLLNPSWESKEPINSWYKDNFQPHLLSSWNFRAGNLSHYTPPCTRHTVDSYNGITSQMSNEQLKGEDITDVNYGSDKNHHEPSKYNGLLVFTIFVHDYWSDVKRSNSTGVCCDAKDTSDTRYQSYPYQT